ncbi:hypothetical protein H1C71_032577 [Ictidomys tridecemlineatus]|nr:hypothetical protein H1C71_032577 [Ictidomys tridecemlineatus]KAG3281967.1 hypothetical protein H1C71_032577 [Ictidomys tridecemlineatus]
MGNASSAEQETQRSSTLGSMILGAEQRKCPARSLLGCSGALSAHPCPVACSLLPDPSHSPAVFLSWMEQGVSSTFGHVLPGKDCFLRFPRGLGGGRNVTQ